MNKLFFRNDYGEGAHPVVLDALVKTNMEHTCGYGLDAYSLKAADLIREKCGKPEAAVHMMVGGTSANMITLASIMRPYEMMKMAIVSIHMVMPTNRLWNHSPKSGPSSIAVSRDSKSTNKVLRSMELSLVMTPAALLTTLCPTSKMPITIFHVLDTISTAEAVLNTHLKNIHVSMSPCILFFSVTI